MMHGNKDENGNKDEEQQRIANFGDTAKFANCSEPAG